MIIRGVEIQFTKFLIVCWVTSKRALDWHSFKIDMVCGSALRSGTVDWKSDSTLAESSITAVILEKWSGAGTVPAEIVAIVS